MAIDELVKIFLDESEDEIRELEAGLIKLEEDQSDEGTINRVFRAAHTIKGSAGLVGFDEVSNFTHDLENILDRIRNRELKITKKLISNLLSATDLLKRMITACASGEELDAAEIEGTTLTLRRFTGSSRPAEGARQHPAVDQPRGEDRVFCVTMRFRPDILSTGQDPLMLIRELADNGTIIETRAFTEGIPDFYNLNPTTCYTWWEAILRTDRPLSDIQNIFLFVIDDNEIIIEDVSSRYKQGVDLSLAEKPIGEILVEKGIVKPPMSRRCSGLKTTGEMW